MIEKLIQKWQKEGIINDEQAAHMLSDISDRVSERRSNRFISVISVIGAVLVGIGILSFIAANWNDLGNIFRIFLIFSITFLTFGLGFYWAIYKKSLVRIGNTLLFLGSLFFGGSIFLIAQIYNVQANADFLILLWILGIIPVVYLFISRLHMLLMCSLIFVYYFFVIIERIESFEVSIFLGLSISLALVILGGLHYYKEKLQDVGRVMRLIGLGSGLIFMYILTFIRGWFYFSDDTLLTMQVIILTAITIIGGLVLLVRRPKFGTQTLNLEIIVAISITFLFYILQIVPVHSVAYLEFIAEFSFVGVCGLILYLGYRRGDMKLVNIGLLATIVYIFGKYVEFFIELLPGVVFFITSGVMLIIGGIILEKKRRQLKLFFRENQHVAK